MRLYIPSGGCLMAPVAALVCLASTAHAQTDPGLAYAYIAGGGVDGASVRSPGNAGVTSVKTAPGTYNVTFPGAGIGTGWNAQAQAQGTTAGHCKVRSLGVVAAGVIEVICMGSDGRSLDSEFRVLAVGTGNLKNIAYGRTNLDGTTIDAASYNPSGTVSGSRISAGRYRMTFGGLEAATVGGTVQVNAFGSLGTWCNASPPFNGGTGLAVEVYCANLASATIDSPFSIAVIPATAKPSALGFTWVDGSTAISQPYTYSSAGAVSLARTGTGRYSVTFAGLAPVRGGIVWVSASDSSAVTNCKVSSWSPNLGTVDMVVSVACFDSQARASDSRFQVLMMAPVVSPQLTLLTPSSARTGSQATTLAVSGTNFVPASQIFWNTTLLATTYVSATRLTGTIPAGLLASGGQMNVTVSHSGVSSNALLFDVIAVVSGTINPGGTVNAASLTAGQAVAPGSLVAIYGQNLSSQTASAGLPPLSTSLGGVSVTVNGFRAPLSYVSPGQINAQVPFEVLPAGTTSAVNVIVAPDNANATPPQSVTISPFGPGVFSSSGHAIAVIYPVDENDPRKLSVAAPVNSIPGLPTNPAKAGDTLLVYATGLGQVSPAPRTGAASSDTLRSTTTTPIVLIGNIPARVTFSGLTPQYVGVYQLNVVVPQMTRGAGVYPLQIQIGGVTSTSSTTVAVQ